MRNFIHIKKGSDTSVPEPADTAAGVESSDAASDTAVSARDVETENLKNAIAQVMADETVVLPHIEQLSSSVARESALARTESSIEAADESEEILADEPEEVVQPVMTAPDGQANISSWFVTFMAMRIPIVGWIYLLYLSFSKKTVNRRNFARAYLLCKLIFLLLGVIILFLIISAAMNILEDLLEYMAML